MTKMWVASLFAAAAVLLGAQARADGGDTAEDASKTAVFALIVGLNASPEPSLPPCVTPTTMARATWSCSARWARARSCWCA